MTTSDAELAGRLATEAGELLIRLRDSGTATGHALGDAGDKAANDFLLSELGRARPDDVVLSEEAADDPARLDAERVWIVDPLDGTREYRHPPRPDWAVHVALWQRNRGLTDGAVALPAMGLTYRSDQLPPLITPGLLPAADRPRVVVSGSRPPDFAADVASAIDGDVVQLGSAGAKAMAVVRGEADAYVHAGGQYEWDSAAPVVVAQAHGFWCSRIDGSPLRYNQPEVYLPDLVVCRPDIAEAVLTAISSAVR